MLYYAIADLHGRLDLLEKAREAINKDHDEFDAPCKVITLGDYIDRGPQSAEVIQRLREWHDYEDFICLKGNHEAMLVETVTTPLMPDWWVGNGGDATLKSYGWGGPPYSAHAYDVIPKADIDWMNNLPYYYETEHHLFVHAGVPQRQMNLPPKNAHSYEEMIWMLYDKREPGWWKEKHVVHGHHQFADGPHEWAGRTDLDTHAWRTGRLVIGVFSSEVPGKAIRYLEVKGDNYGS